MKNLRIRATLFLIICFTFNLSASYRSEVYNAFITNNMQSWKSVIDRMQTAASKTNEDLLELVNFQYGYIAWCVGNKKSDDAHKYLDLADINLEVLSKSNKNVSIVNSYKSAFYGYRIGLNKIKAPFLGPKSLDCAKLAVASDKENPFGYVQLGNIEFYMPAAFGGSKKEALGYYLTALSLMDKNEKDNLENWNYISLLTVIAQAYYYINDFQSSLSYIEKILKLEPDYGWVKNDLYPMVLRKMKEQDIT
jgi:tetratricopeptide (TPR) repeat protein